MDNANSLTGPGPIAHSDAMMWGITGRRVVGGLGRVLVAISLVAGLAASAQSTVKSRVESPDAPVPVRVERPGPALRSALAARARGDADAAEGLRLLLQSLGHQVHVEHDGHRALVRARKVSPDVLFLDIGLPNMDGYELAHRLRGMPETAEAMLVAVTGYGQPEDRDRAHEAGFDHHVVKPVKLETILRLLPKR